MQCCAEDTSARIALTTGSTQRRHINYTKILAVLISQCV
jgi:hypothetical protein